jgi:hypothetical protein
MRKFPQFSDDTDMIEYGEDQNGIIMVDALIEAQARLAEWECDGTSLSRQVELQANLVKAKKELIKYISLLRTSLTIWKGDQDNEGG